MARIAFLACNKRPDLYARDPAFVYRCMNLAYGVAAQGHEVWCGHLAAFPWMQTWDVVVLHRPRSTLRWWVVTSWLRRRGVRVLADVDDLVMDPALAQCSPGVMNGLVSLSATQKQFAAHQRALLAVDGISVSTQPLAEHIRRLMPSVPVLVIPNAVHHSWRHRPVVHSNPGVQVLAYMPGTRSHDRDFAMLVPAMERVLQRHPETQLRVTGPLNFRLNARNGQVTHLEKLPFEDYHRCFEGVAINLAPLEETPFTLCKSALKIMEAAWWNVPTVCSDFPDAARFDKVGALRASSAQEFEDHLECLLVNSDRLHAQSLGLRDRVLPLADVMATSRLWLNFAMEL